MLTAVPAGPWSHEERDARECGADGCVRQRHVWDVSVTDPPPPFGLCCRRLQTAGPAAAAGLASAPDARSDGSLGTAPPTTPRGASSPGTGGGGGGTRGAEGDICAFSVQLPDRSCRISELRDQTAAGGSPLPGGLTQARTVCQQIPSAPQPCSSEGPADSSGAAVLAGSARKSIFPAHTHTLPLSP